MAPGRLPFLIQINHCQRSPTRGAGCTKDVPREFLSKTKADYALRHRWTLPPGTACSFSGTDHRNHQSPAAVLAVSGLCRDMK
jgi:hypothetical protein